MPCPRRESISTSTTQNKYGDEKFFKVSFTWCPGDRRDHGAGALGPGARDSSQTQQAAVSHCGYLVHPDSFSVLPIGSLASC